MMKRTEFMLALLFVFQVSHNALGQQVKAFVGDRSVALPCIMTDLGSKVGLLALWTRGGSEQVHLRDSDGDDHRQQSPTFKDRTKMNPDALQTGILTLDLDRPVISDSGVYSCLARVGVTEVGRTNVELQVKVRPGPDPGPDPGAGAGAVAGAIAGGVVGGAVALTALGLVAAAFKRKKSSKESFTDAFVGLICCRPSHVL